MLGEGSSVTAPTAEAGSSAGPAQESIGPSSYDPFPVVVVPDADRGRATFPNQTYHAIRRTA